MISRCTLISINFSNRKKRRDDAGTYYEAPDQVKKKKHTGVYIVYFDPLLVPPFGAPVKRRVGASIHESELIVCSHSHAPPPPQYILEEKHMGPLLRLPALFFTGVAASTEAELRSHRGTMTYLGWVQAYMH